MAATGAIRMRRQAGLSLIELMVALTLGAFLLIGLVQLFSASRQAFAASQGLSRVQETGRTAVDWMQRDVRMAGHLGCVSDQAVFASANPRFQNLLEVRASAGPPIVLAAPAPFLYQLGNGVQGFEANGTGPAGTLILSAVENPAGAAAGAWTPDLPAELGPILAAGEGRAVPGSDIIVVRYFSAESIPVQLLAPGAVSTITLPPGTNAANPDFLRAGGIYGISDCIQAAAFQLSGVAGDTLTVNAAGLNLRAFDGTAQFAQGSVMYRVEAAVYYVGIGANGQPSLFRWLANPTAAGLNPRREELLDGVETMQLQFGIDTAPALSLPDGLINVYSAATAVNTVGGAVPGMAVENQWRRSGAVRIGLLVRSPERAQSQAAVASEYQVNGVTVTTFEDGRVRHVYETVVAMRNRLFGN